MKALASSDSFLGLPERGKFATEPVGPHRLMLPMYQPAKTNK